MSTAEKREWIRFVMKNHLISCHVMSFLFLPLLSYHIKSNFNYILKCASFELTYHIISFAHSFHYIMKYCIHDLTTYHIISYHPLLHTPLLYTIHDLTTYHIISSFTSHSSAIHHTWLDNISYHIILYFTLLCSTLSHLTLILSSLLTLNLSSLLFSVLFYTYSYPFLFYSILIILFYSPTWRNSELHHSRMPRPREGSRALDAVMLPLLDIEVRWIRKNRWQEGKEDIEIIKKKDILSSFFLFLLTSNLSLSICLSIDLPLSISPLLSPSLFYSHYVSLSLSLSPPLSFTLPLSFCLSPSLFYSHYVSLSISLSSLSLTFFHSLFSLHMRY